MAQHVDLNIYREVLRGLGEAPARKGQREVGGQWVQKVSPGAQLWAMTHPEHHFRAGEWALPLISPVSLSPTHSEFTVDSVRNCLSVLLALLTLASNHLDNSLYDFGN